MAKSKQKINEDILQMGRLMNYNRGLTSTENTVLFENKASGKKQLNEILAGALGAAVAYKIGMGVKNWATKLGDSKKFNLGTGDVYGKYLFEMEPLQIEGIDLLDSSTVQEIATAFYEATETYRTYQTDEDAVYRLVKTCETVVGLSQVAEEYQATYGNKLREILIDEMSDDKTELNRMFSIAQRLPLLSFNGKEIRNFSDLKKFIETSKKEKEELEKGKYAPDLSLITINGEDLAFDYEMTMEAQAKFDEYIKNPKYINKWTPEFLAAQAIAKTARQPIEVGYPGDGRKVVEVEVEDEFAAESHKRKLGLTEGTVKGDGAGNIVNKKGDPEKNTDDNTDKDEDGNTDSKTKSSGGSSWKKAPDSEPTKGDKSTFVSKGHYNKNEGSVVKRIQKALGIKEDGLYGPGTKAAVEKYQKENGLDVDGVVGYDTWVKMSASNDKLGKEGDTGKEEITNADSQEMDKITKEKEGADKETIKSQMDQLKTAISEQPTKQACKELIATAAAGLKHGVRLTDTSSLGQCYNSYDFFLFKGSGKVKKAYNLKGKGN